MSENKHIDTAALAKTIPYMRSLERTSEDAAYQPFLTFTDRDSYLEWVAEWKAQYKELSATIRQQRKEWRAEGSEHSNPLSYSLYRNRALARAMLELRKASKVRAQVLYEEAKASVVA